jgi:hypothetical protein
MLNRKAERQLEVIAPDQQGNLLVLCRSMQDIQAVQEKLSRERWRLSVMPTMRLPTQEKGIHAKEHND